MIITTVFIADTVGANLNTDEKILKLPLSKSM